MRIAFTSGGTHFAVNSKDSFFRAVARSGYNDCLVFLKSSIASPVRRVDLNTVEPICRINVTLSFPLFVLSSALKFNVTIRRRVTYFHTELLRREYTDHNCFGPRGTGTVWDFRRGDQRPCLQKFEEVFRSVAETITLKIIQECEDGVFPHFATQVWLKPHQENRRRKGGIHTRLV